MTSMSGFYYQHSSEENVILVAYSYKSAFLFLWDKVTMVNNFDGVLIPFNQPVIEKKIQFVVDKKRGTQLKDSIYQRIKRNLSKIQQMGVNDD